VGPRLDRTFRLKETIIPRAIVDPHQAGEELTTIAMELDFPYSAVRRLQRR
jgi:hypothetical protein